MQRVGSFITVVTLCAALVHAAPPEDPNRPYRDGPLTANDFQAEPDPAQSYTAWTQTHFRHRYNYRFLTKSGETVVTLSEIEVWGVVARDKSWNRRLRDAVLMDHEQGHFDLTQIYALAAQASLQKRIDKGPALQTRAKTKAEAVQRLEARVLEVMQPYITDSIAAHSQYDKATSNGNDVIAQAEARRDHKRRMEALLDAAEPVAP